MCVCVCESAGSLEPDSPLAAELLVGHLGTQYKNILRGKIRKGMAAALPRTLGELQLYRILQRANLLYYYDAFIQQGGDDVQQLCEAGEEEFLEIMALVGMASKPLHVRRLQKALRDWVTNPALFNQPLAALPVCSIPVYKLPEGSPREPHAKAPKCAAAAAARRRAPLLGGPRDGERAEPVPADAGSPSSPRDPLEALDAAAVRSVAECVERMGPALAKGDLAEVREQLRGNKKLAKMISHILDMGEEEPRREEEVRKYSAIYGRFDSKRKDGKHLTLHELTVNEAAAQLCMKDVGLLARRDELFSLARQISREVTYKYTYRTSKSRCGDRDEPSPKRIKAEEGFFDLQEALQAIHMRQETLREQLVQAKSKGEETLGQNIQVTEDTRAGNVSSRLPVSLAAFQSHERRNSWSGQEEQQERLQALDWRIPSLSEQPAKKSSNSRPASEQHAERPLNLRVPGHRQGGARGDTPLGKQLANELKRRHSTGDGKTPSTENGHGIDFSHHVLNLSDKKTIKMEPEDSR
ncbi:hypothetical protein ANANG_G00280840 [Anguilla anguilla]|uniref:Uncharacterized protein n=1 Tax=Anguilla anguilla TaxID=7936 RepID=A0A9D3LWG4_ANGAN|nr:hypothetical protein ANANG_G00280840 [Anguilla anguilla]